MTITLLHGDCRSLLPTLPANSVQCVVTSPPYYGLRDYGVVGQLGLEPTPDAYLATMVAVFRELRRVLRDDGTCWVNLGDSFSGGNQVGWRAGNPDKNGGNSNRDGVGCVPGLAAKQLLMMPARLALALQADGWWLRSDIIWHKPNPMPESVTDRPTNAHEHVFLLTKRSRYYYDGDAVREPNQSLDDDGNHIWTGRPIAELGMAPHKEAGRQYSGVGLDPIKGATGLRSMGYNLSGRNLRNVWTIATHAYPGAHFATFPPALAERCIRAGSRPSDTILDPFSGAGTALLVADRLGRNAIGIDLSHAYMDMARARLVDDCPLFADLSPPPANCEDAYDRPMRDLFEEAAD